MESGIYFGWAGLSPSKATQSSPAGGKYDLMQKDIYDSLLQATKSRVTSSSLAGVESGRVYPMVMSIGWNPFYKNSVRSVEVHIMAPFATDFYDSHMNLVVLGFIRPEYDYVSKESLVDDIKTDIDVAGRSLAREAYLEFLGEEGLRRFEGVSETAS